jgi:hypothetical protein
MKNKILWTALAAMSLAACSNDDVVSIPKNDNAASDAIQFRTSVTNSRATIANTTNLESFWVGALTDDGVQNNKLYWGNDSFKYFKKSTVNNQTVFSPIVYGSNPEVADDDATWPASSLKFYATNLNLGAAAVAAAQGTTLANQFSINPPDVGSDNSNVPTVFYKIANKVKDQEDVIYATNRGSRADFSNTGSVPLDFRHALCQIIIKAKNSMSDYTIKVRGFKIYKAGFNQGTFSMPVAVNIGGATPEATESPAGTWKFEDADKTTSTTLYSSIRGLYNTTAGTGVRLYSDISNNPQTLNTGAVKIVGATDGSDGEAMAIPINSEGNVTDAGKITGYHLGAGGNQNNDGTYIALLVQIDDKNGNPVFPAPLKDTDGTVTGRISYRGLPKYYGYVAAPVTIQWEAGKVYTYTLDFKDGLGISDPYQPETVDPEKYDPGTDPGEGDLDEEKKGETDPIDKGENILGKAIAFDVEVSSWGSTTNTTVNM